MRRDPFGRSNRRRDLRGGQLLRREKVAAFCDWPSLFMGASDVLVLEKGL